MNHQLHCLLSPFVAGDWSLLPELCPLSPRVVGGEEWEGVFSALIRGSYDSRYVCFVSVSLPSPFVLSVKQALVLGVWPMNFQSTSHLYESGSPTLHWVSILWPSSEVIPFSCSFPHSSPAPPPQSGAHTVCFGTLSTFFGLHRILGKFGDRRGCGLETKFMFLYNEPKRKRKGLTFSSDFLLNSSESIWAHVFSFNHFLTKTKTDY